MKKYIPITIGLLCSLFFSCSDNNDNMTTANLGRVNVYIQGDITNAEAAAKLATELGTLTENIYVQNTTQLTTLSIQGKGNMVGIYINFNLALNSITINGITKINDFEFDYPGNTISTPVTIVCNDLEVIDNLLNINLSQNLNNNVSFNDLKTLNTGYNFDSSVISGSFGTLNFPVLLEEKGALIFDNISMNSITFPVLKSAYSLSFENSNIQELNLPKILSCKGFYFQGNYQTNTIINIPLLNYCNDFSIRAMNFNSVKTNDWLHQLLTILPTSGKNIELYSWPLPAPPTGQGIDDKNTLIANGNTVLTN